MRYSPECPDAGFRQRHKPPAKAIDYLVSGLPFAVVVGERIVNTESYDGYDWEPLIVTTRFAGIDEGRTRIEVAVLYPSKEICDRDAPNLEDGAPTYRRLAELLASQDEGR